MSQEQPPIRSRRELRQARDERLDTPGPGEPTEAEITGRSRRVADAPVDSVRADSVPAGTERSSQVRARDRAALRTIKELAEKEGQLAGGGPPTRRQLRLLELATETAPATQANTIVPVSPRTRATPVVSPAPKDAASRTPPEGRRREGRCSGWGGRPGAQGPRCAQGSRGRRRRTGRGDARGHDRGAGAGRPRTPRGAGQEPSGQDGTHRGHGSGCR